MSGIGHKALHAHVRVFSGWAPRGGMVSPATYRQVAPQKAASHHTPSSFAELPLTLKMTFLSVTAAHGVGCFNLIPREKEHLLIDYWPFAFHL